MKFIAFDTETGGLNTKCSVLSAYFIVFDSNFKSLGELNLKIKPDDGNYVVTAEALKVNNINLVEHNKIAVSTTQAKKELLEFLNNMTESGRFKLMPVGHNVSFDTQFLLAHLIDSALWNSFISYHSLDTMHVANFLKICGLIPSSQKISLSNLADFFNIKTKQLHDAKEDTVACVKVLKKMMLLLKKETEHEQ
jgi:DNA polymerase III epsilon subunit-like protein